MEYYDYEAEVDQSDLDESEDHISEILLRVDDMSETNPTLSSNDEEPQNSEENRYEENDKLPLDGNDGKVSKLSKKDVLDDIFASLVIDDKSVVETDNSVATRTISSGEENACDHASGDLEGIERKGSNLDFDPTSPDITRNTSFTRDITLAEQLEHIQNADRNVEDEDRSGSGWFSWRSKASNNSKRSSGGKSLGSSSGPMDKSECSSFMESSILDEELNQSGHPTCSESDVSHFENKAMPETDSVKDQIETEEDGEEDPYGFDEDFNHDAVIKEFHSEHSRGGLSGGDSHSIEDCNEINDSFEDDNCSKGEESCDDGEKEDTLSDDLKNQALFDIIEQSFDSIEPFSVAGLEKDLKNTEVKLCFAAYVYVFTPPKPTPFAVQFNHNIDQKIREERLMKEERQKSEKKGWLFNWKKAKSISPIKNSKSMSKQEEDEKYTFEVVPKNIVYALWTELLRQIGVKVLEIGSDVLTIILDHIRDSLVQVGLLDSSIIDLTNDQASSSNFDHAYSNHDNDVILECEYIAAHHAINGQYGKYLSKCHRKIKETLERYDTSLFAAVSDIPDEGTLSVRDYCFGMLPSTCSRGKLSRRAIKLLTKNTFVDGRLGYFGILEGCTIQVTDVEIVTNEQGNGKNDNFDYDEFMNKAYGLVTSFIGEEIHEDKMHEDRIHDEQEESYLDGGKAFHLVAVSFVAQGLVGEGLECFAEALRLKKIHLNWSGMKQSVAISDTLHCMGLAYGINGDSSEALSSYAEALRIRRNLLGRDDLRVADTCHSMGAMLCEIGGDLSEAKEALSEALRIREESLDEEDESTSETRQWMGNVLKDLGECELALECYQASLRTKKLIFGEDHEEVANTMMSIAIVLDQLNDYSSSIQYYKEVLRIRNSLHGRGVVVADTFLCIGKTYLELDKHSAAYDNLKESISIREKMLLDLLPNEKESSFFTFFADTEIDNDELTEQYTKLLECYEAFLPLYKRLHNDTEIVAKYLRQMGELYFELKDYDSAMKSYQTALGAGFTGSAAELRQKIGCINIVKGDYAKAQAVLIECITDQKEEYGDASPLLFTTLYNLGVCLHYMQRHELSLSTFLKAMDSLTSTKGDTRIGYVQFWIGKEYHQILDYSRAIGMLEKALIRFKQEHSKNNDEAMLICLHSLGDTYACNDKFAMALKCFNGEIKLYEVANGAKTKGGARYAEANFYAGNVYSRMMNFDKARACYEKTLIVLGKGPSEKVAGTLEALGTIHLKEKRQDQAKALLTAAFKMYNSVLGPHHDCTVSTSFELAKLLDSLSQFDSALNYYEICLEAKETKYGNNHEEVATILYNLGKNRFASSHIEDSLLYLEQALAIRKKVLDSDHFDNALTFYELAKIYKSQSKSDKAALCYKEALRIFKAAGRPSEAGNVSLELASLYDEQNDAILATGSYCNCLKLLSSSHKLIPHIHFRLGNLYESLDNPNDAIKYYNDYLDLLGAGVKNDETYVSSIRALSRLHTRVGQYETALTFATELIQYIEISASNEDLASIYHETGVICSKMKNYNKALNYLKISASLQKSMNDEQNNNRMGKVLTDLSAVQEVLEDFESASNSLLEALFIFKLKRNDNERVSTLISLARIYEKVENFDGAKECYEDCIEIQKSFSRPTDLLMANIYVKMGCLLTKMNDDSRSMILLKAALKIQEKAKSFSDQAFTLQQMSEIHIRKLSYDEALVSLVQVLRLRSKLHQDADQDSADCNRQIGIIHSEREDYKRAIAPLKEASRLYKKLDADHRRQSSASHLLSRAYCMVRNFEEGREYVVEAMALRKLNPGPGSTDYAHSLTCLGEIDFGEGKIDDALTNLTQALDIYRNCDDYVWSWETLRIQELVGRILFLREDYDNARRAFDTCLLKCEDDFKGEDEMISNIHLMRGKIFAKEGSLDSAYDSFKRCLSIRKRHGKVKESVAEVLIEIGRVLLEQEQYSNSIGYYQEGVRLRKLLGKTRGIPFLQSQIGEAHLNLGNYEEAIRILEEAKVAMSELKYDHNIDLAHLESKLGLAYSSYGKEDSALKSFLQAIGSFGIFENRSRVDEISMASAMHNAGIILAGKNEFQHAADLFSKSLPIRESYLEMDSTEIADSLFWYAKTRTDKSDEVSVIKMLSDAKRIYSRRQRHQEHASCLLALGSIMQKSDFDKAMLLYNEARQLYTDHHIEEGSELAEILFWIGFNMNQKLCFQQSADVLKQCLKLRIQTEGKNSLNVAKTCEQLGACLLSLNHHEDSLKLYTTSLEIYKDVLGDNTAECARVMLDIGTIYSHLQNFELSLIQLNACLEFFEEEHGKESEEVAAVLLRMGQVYDLQVDNEEAMNCVTKALDIRTKLFTKEDPRVAETYLICGRLLEDWGDLEEAMSCFQNALQIYQLQKDEDKVVATIHDQIAGIYAEKGALNEAIESYNEALSIYQDQLGDRSSEVGHTLRNLGAIFDSKKDYETSYKYYMDALKILRQVFGDKDLSVALCLNNVGINLARRKKYRKAIDLCTVALRIRKAGLPKNHLEIADTLTNLANILDDCNKDTQALKFYSEALVIYKDNFGKDNEDVANCLKSIGFIKIRLEHTDEAISTLTEALRILRMKIGSDSLPCSEILYHLGRIYGKQQKFENSLGCFRESLRIRREVLDPSHKDIVDTARFVEAIRRKIESDKRENEVDIYD